MGQHTRSAQFADTAACGAILGDNVGFWVGRRFGWTLLLKHGHPIGTNERVKKQIEIGGDIIFLPDLTRVTGNVIDASGDSGSKGRVWRSQRVPVCW
jgi:hypothetical protein